MSYPTGAYSWSSIGFPLSIITLKAWFARNDKTAYDNLVAQAESFAKKSMQITDAEAKEMVQNFLQK